MFLLHLMFLCFSSFSAAVLGKKSMVLLPILNIVSHLLFSISLQELKDVLHTVPEIVEMIGDADTNRVLLLNDEDDEDDLKSALRLAFTQLMSASKSLISKAISELKRRLNSESEVAMQCFIWFSMEHFFF